MAQRTSSFVLACLFLVLSFRGAFTFKQGQYGMPKSLHFTLYQHETLNKTGFLIVTGVETGAPMTPSSAPIGTLFAFQDPLTATVNRSSKVLGIAEGLSMISSVDGLQCLNVGKLSLNLKNHKGSVSVVGGTHNTKARNLPVVGGTGDFTFVQGYMTSTPVAGLVLTYKVDFRLHWPPYVTSLHVQDH